MKARVRAAAARADVSGKRLGDIVQPLGNDVLPMERLL